MPVILDLLERQLDVEPLTSVRMCMAHTVNSVGKYDAEKAVVLLKRLIAPGLSVLQSHSAQHILNWAVPDYANVVADFAIELIWIN